MWVVEAMHQMCALNHFHHSSVEFSGISFGLASKMGCSLKTAFNTTWKLRKTVSPDLPICLLITLFLIWCPTMWRKLQTISSIVVCLVPCNLPWVFSNWHNLRKALQSIIQFSKHWVSLYQSISYKLTNLIWYLCLNPLVDAMEHRRLFIFLWTITTARRSKNMVNMFSITSMCKSVSVTKRIFCLTDKWVIVVSPNPVTKNYSITSTNSLNSAQQKADNMSKYTNKTNNPLLIPLTLYPQFHYNLTMQKWQFK